MIATQPPGDSLATVSLHPQRLDPGYHVRKLRKILPMPLCRHTEHPLGRLVYNHRKHTANTDFTLDTSRMDRF